MFGVNHLQCYGKHSLSYFIERQHVEYHIDQDFIVESKNGIYFLCDPCVDYVEIDLLDVYLIHYSLIRSFHLFVEVCGKDGRLYHFLFTVRESEV